MDLGAHILGIRENMHLLVLCGSTIGTLMAWHDGESLFPFGAKTPKKKANLLMLFMSTIITVPIMLLIVFVVYEPESAKTAFVIGVLLTYYIHGGYFNRVISGKGETVNSNGATA